VTLATTIREQTMPSENALDGAGAWQRRNLFLLEAAANGRGAELSQRAVRLEPAAQSDDALSQTFWGSVARLRIASRTVLPIDAIQAQTTRTAQPAVSGIEADLEAASHGAKRGTPAERSNDEPPLAVGFFSAIADRALEYARKTTRRRHARAAAPFRLATLAFTGPPREHGGSSSAL
jgi:hypothetical protein